MPRRWASRKLTKWEKRDVSSSFFLCLLRDFRITTTEFKQKIESGEAKVLTLEAARALKGKKITWSYFGYNPMELHENVIGDIVSEWDYNKKCPMEGYESRTAYWDSYMTQAEKNYSKCRMELLDQSGYLTFMYCELVRGLFDEPRFVCSDSDRSVFYLLNE